MRRSKNDPRETWPFHPKLLLETKVIISVTVQKGGKSCVANACASPKPRSGDRNPAVGEASVEGENETHGKNEKTNRTA